MKKTIYTIVLILAILSLGTSSAYAQGEELVVNGDFEFPVVTTPFPSWDIYPSGTPNIGWNVEWAGGADTYAGLTRPAVANLELHNPDGLWPSYEGIQYAELDSDWDGRFGSVVGEPASIKLSQEIPTCAAGTYELQYAWSTRPSHADNRIEVWFGDDLVATHSGSGGATTAWTLETATVTAGGDLTVLAFVETATSDSYGMFLDAVSLVSVGTCVDIDIIPGKFPNVIKPNTTRSVPVAILGSETFDVTQVDTWSLIFAGLYPRMRGDVPFCIRTDVNADGFTDLTCYFAFNRNTFSPDNGTATLTGRLLDGTPFSGSDSIVVR